MTSTSLSATTTRCRTRSPFAPRSNFTIHFTTSSITSACFCKWRTRITTTRRLGYDLARTSSCATTAMLRTLAPFSPGTNFTIHFATFSITRTCVCKRTTRVTTTRRLSHDLTRTSPCATTTISGALAPFSPGTNFTIHFATFSITRTCVCKRTTRVTTTRRRSDDLTRTMSCATTTMCGALAPFSPGTNLTVHFAALSITSTCCF